MLSLENPRWGFHMIAYDTPPNEQRSSRSAEEE